MNNVYINLYTSVNPQPQNSLLQNIMNVRPEKTAGIATNKIEDAPVQMKNRGEDKFK